MIEIENDRNRKRPKWKTTEIENDRNRKRPKQRTIETENDRNRKRPKWKTTKKSNISTSFTYNKINLDQQNQPNIMVVTLKQFNLVISDNY